MVFYDSFLSILTCRARHTGAILCRIGGGFLLANVSIAGAARRWAAVGQDLGTVLGYPGLLDLARIVQQHIGRDSEETRYAEDQVCAWPGLAILKIADMRIGDADLSGQLSCCHLLPLAQDTQLFPEAANCGIFWLLTHKQ